MENEKKHGFTDTIKTGLGHISNIISAFILPHIEEGAEKVMKNIDDRIKLVENRILKKITSQIIIRFGILFLIFALLFFLIEYLGWSKALALFSIGIIIFVIGLLIKLRDSDK